MANKILKFHAGMIVFSSAMGIILNPDYDDRNCFRRNCFNGFEMGLFVGIMWPFSYPIMTYCYVKHMSKLDPVREIKKTDWTKNFRKEADKILKDMKGKDPPSPQPF